MADDDAVARLMMMLMIVVLEGPGLGSAVPLDRCSSSRRRRVIFVMEANNSNETTRIETAGATAARGNHRCS